MASGVPFFMITHWTKKHKHTKNVENELAQPYTIHMLYLIAHHVCKSRHRGMGISVIIAHRQATTYSFHSRKKIIKKVVKFRIIIICVIYFINRNNERNITRRCFYVIIVITRIMSTTYQTL